MKKLILSSTIAATIIGISTAEYTIKYTIEPTPNSVNIVDWAGTSPSFTPWTEKGSNFDCSVWNPNENTITIGQSFQQSRDCSVNEERYRQERSLSETGKYRNEGSPALEERVSPRTETNQSIGTLETWISTSPTYSSWVNSGSIYGCSNWSPNPNTVTINQSFTQTATDCEQNQVRDRQDRETETTTNAIRNSGAVVVENQILSNITNTRTATGTKETWAATTPTYTAWVNSGVIYGCSNWSPNPNTVTINQSFTQTANDCELNQTRNRQDREIETTTNNIRNVGEVVVENQTLTTQTNTRSATGTKETWVATTPTYTAWTNTSGAYSCSGWTPDPSTVNSGQYFVQKSNNCYVNQSRNRQNREIETTNGTVRNLGAAYAETQTIGGQYGEQGATGTKIVAVYPTIHSFSGSSIWNRIDCNFIANASWSVSNAVSYSVSTPIGTYSGGTTSMPPKTSRNSFSGTWTLTACSNTGHCSNSAISVPLGSKGRCS